MAESMDSLDFLPEITATENDAIPLDCWQKFNLSDIWIPSYLLPNRNEPVKVHHGIYHTLEKKDPSKYIKSFSVYLSNSTGNEEGEIFISDSDDDIFGSDSISVEKLQISEDTNNSPYLDETCHRENLTMTTNLMKISGNSNENQINWKNRQQNERSLCDKKDTKGGKKGKKNKKDKGKKKTYIVLDDFLETNTEASQEYHCDKYFQKILKDKQTDTPYSNMDFPHLTSNEHTFTQSDKREKESSYTNIHVGYNMDSPHLTSNEHLFIQSGKRDKETSYTNTHKGNNMDFPDLASNEHMLTHCDKRGKEASYTNIHVASNTEFPYLASDEHLFTQSNKREKENFECGLLETNENINDVKEIEPHTTDVICGNIVIENIPHDTTKDDVLAILCGYGEIKEFSLVSTGNYFTAYVQIDLICDIDWIIECLNGSEPFGASSEKIYCYKQ